MATLILATAASTIGSSLGLGTIGAGLLGSVGAFVGGSLDNAILGTGNARTSRRTDAFPLPQITTSSYGQPIPQAFGMVRLAGNILWLSDARQTTLQQTQKVRTGKFSTRTVTTDIGQVTEIDLALALTAVPSNGATLAQNESNNADTTSFQTRGAIVGIRRIWADSELLYDARTFNLAPQQLDTFRLEALSDGAETRNPNGFMVSVLGTNQVPAFRGLAYLVLRDFRISDFGNRIPNLTVEVVASLPRIPTGEHPEGICEGTNGDIYTVSHLQRTITRFDAVDLKVKSVLGDTGDYLGSYKAHPWRIAASPLDGHLWITCQGDACVQRVNPVSGAVIATIDTGNYPHDICFDNTGKPWVTFPTLNRVSRLNPATNTVDANYTVSGAPWAMTKGHDGDIWVTTNTDVVRLNPTNGTVKARINVGFFPWGIACNPVTTHVWVAVNGNDFLRVINPANNSILTTRNTGTYPTAVSCHPDDEHGSVAVTLKYGNQLKVYSRTYAELLEYGTIAFPAYCLQRANGDVFITQSKYNFILHAQGR